MISLRNKRLRGIQSASAIAAALQDEDDSDEDDDDPSDDEESDNPRWQLYQSVKSMSDL